jgi:lysozyme family protein
LRPGEDLAVFDLAVNSGVQRARDMYISCIKHRKSLSLADDPAAIAKDLCAARMAFLRRLATWKIFGTGWSRRIAACEASGIRMAGDFLDAQVAAVQDEGTKEA